MKNGTILIVEDQDTNRKLLCRLFQDEYEVLEAVDGEEAIHQLEEHRDEISAVLLDIIMPKVDGFGVMEYMIRYDYMEEMPVVMITGDTAMETKEKAFSLGASDVVDKPYDPFVIRKRIRNLIELWAHKNQLEDLVDQQTKKIQEQNRRIKEMNYHIIDTLGTVVEFRNLESSNHILRVRELTKVLIKTVAMCYPEFGLTDEDIDNISYASAMHDIGKIAIPDKILLKPARLTDEERQVMQSHTLHGAEIIEHVLSEEDSNDYMRYSLEIARSHHERYDGKGYPDGLVGDQIPLSAQVVSIADVYDALVSERVYKGAYTSDEAYRMILNGECGVFNPKLINCFRLVREDFERLTAELI
ncbi:MAG: response regulator [Lachnospiraceae bacterium]|nr:response regulator [Lachnospiraceae bacterium]